MSSLDIGLVAQNIVRQDGQGRVMVELARMLVDRGHRVTVYTLRCTDELAGRVAQPRVWRLDELGPATTWTFFAGATKAVRAGSHDLSCVMGPCALPKAPFVYYAQFSHSGWQQTWKTGGTPAARHRVLSHLGRWMERMVVPRAALVVACHDDVGRQLGVPADRVVTVPNGIDIGEFDRASAGRAALRERYGLPVDSWVVAFVGEYNTPRKGLDVLLAAVARGPADEHLVVAGSGDQGALVRRATAMGVGHRVHAIGFADPAEVLAGADVAAVPSRYEPFSIVALEAAASRVPIVLSATAGAADSLCDGAAVIQDPEDAGEVRRLLDAVRSAPEVTARRVERARAVARELSWSRVASQAADALESAARPR